MPLTRPPLMPRRDAAVANWRKPCFSHVMSRCFHDLCYLRRLAVVAEERRAGNSQELPLAFKSGFGFLDLLLLAKLLVSLQLSLGALLKSFGFPVYVSERVSILLAFHRIYSRVGFYSPKCSLGRLVGSHDCRATILEGMAGRTRQCIRGSTPTVKMLALTFLLLIGVTLIAVCWVAHLQGVCVLHNGLRSIRGDAQFEGAGGCKLRRECCFPEATQDRHYSRTYTPQPQCADSCRERRL